MKINREDVVQAALIVERWCSGIENCMAECPFFIGFNSRPCALDRETPEEWKLEEYLRTRGLPHDGRGGDGHGHVDARAEADEMRALAAAHGIGG